MFTMAKVKDDSRSAYTQNEKGIATIFSLIQRTDSPL